MNKKQFSQQNYIKLFKLKGKKEKKKKPSLTDATEIAHRKGEHSPCFSLLELTACGQWKQKSMVKAGAEGSPVRVRCSIT